MLRVTRSMMTTAERDAFRRMRPGILFRKRRRQHEEELAAGECNQYVADVERVWDLTECVPTCCPNSYLIDTGDDRFLQVESYRHFHKRHGAFPGTNIMVRCSPQSGLILSATVDGPPVEFASPSLRDLVPEYLEREVGLRGVEELDEAIRDRIAAG